VFLWDSRDIVAYGAKTIQTQYRSQNKTPSHNTVSVVYINSLPITITLPLSGFHANSACHVPVLNYSPPPFQNGSSPTLALSQRRKR